MCVCVWQTTIIYGVLNKKLVFLQVPDDPAFKTGVRPLFSFKLNIPRGQLFKRNSGMKTEKPTNKNPYGVIYNSLSSLSICEGHSLALLFLVNWETYKRNIVRNKKNFPLFKNEIFPTVIEKLVIGKTICPKT